MSPSLFPTLYSESVEAGANAAVGAMRSKKKNRATYHLNLPSCTDKQVLCFHQSSLESVVELNRKELRQSVRGLTACKNSSTSGDSVAILSGTFRLFEGKWDKMEDCMALPSFPCLILCQN